MAVTEYNYIPKYIKRTIANKPKDVITHSYWNELFNLLITQGDHTAEELGNILNHFTAAITEVKGITDDKYVKPTNGIPKTDLAQDVQNSLNKADTALQEHQSLAAYRTAEAQDLIDNTKQDNLIAGKNINIAEDGRTISATSDMDDVIGYFEVTLTERGDGLYTGSKTFAQVKAEIESNKRFMFIDGYDCVLIVTRVGNALIEFAGMSDGTDGWLWVGVASDERWEIVPEVRVTLDWYNALDDAIGKLTNLTTTDKTSLVAAINEVKQAADGKQDKLIAGENITIAADGKTISATCGGSTVELDTTLTQSGKAADAKAVGDVTIRQAELGEDGVASFKNAAGIVLFTVDFSNLTPAVYGDMVISAEAVEISEGGSGTFAVHLATAPTVNQPVYLAVSDNTRLSVSPSSLTFTPENYATPQTVTVTSAQDDDEDDNTITVTLTSRKVDAKQVLVNITDDDKYVPWGGKEVVSFIRKSTYATTDDGCTYYDEANDETITQAGNHKNIWPFKTGVTGANLQGTPTKARGLLEANTTGAYSLIEVWNGIAIPQKVYMSGMSGINTYAITNVFLNNSWESIAIALEGMKYRNTAGELATQTLAETASDVLKNELPFTTEGWTKGVTTTVFTATGEVVFYGGNVEVYRIAAPADFVSWDWNLSAQSWAKLSYSNSEPLDSIIIVNDAVTPEDITKFYEHEVEANF